MPSGDAIQLSGSWRKQSERIDRRIAFEHVEHDESAGDALEGAADCLLELRVRDVDCGDVIDEVDVLPL